MKLAPTIAALAAAGSIAGAAACGHDKGAAATASASPTKADPDAAFGAPLGACVTEDGDRPSSCDAYYDVPAEQRELLQRGCNGSNQRWIAACPAPNRLAA
jgi:hypothetical protein